MDIMRQSVCLVVNPVTVYKYSRTSMARTLMAHSLWLARTITVVPTGHFRHNPPWMAGTTLG